MLVHVAQEATDNRGNELGAGPDEGPGFAHVEPVVDDAFGRIETTAPVAEGANDPAGRGHGQGRDDSVVNFSHSTISRPPPAAAGTRCRCGPQAAPSGAWRGCASRSRCTGHVRWMPGALLGASARPIARFSMPCARAGHAIDESMLSGRGQEAGC